MSELDEKQLLSRAGEDYSRGRFSEAIDKYTEIINRFPASVNGYYGLASSYFRLRQDSQALEYARLTLNIDSRFAPGHVLRGMIFDRAKNDSASESEFKRAFELDANLYTPNLYLGALYLRQRKYDLAYACASRAFHQKKNLRTTLAVAVTWLYEFPILTFFFMQVINVTLIMTRSPGAIMSGSIAITSGIMVGIEYWKRHQIKTSQIVLIFSLGVLLFSIYWFFLL